MKYVDTSAVLRVCLNPELSGMQKHNATVPDFIETDRDFTVRLRK
jgi:hypothetical protein